MTHPAPLLDAPWCARWSDSIQNDPEIGHIGRWCTLDLALSAEPKERGSGWKQD